MRLYAVAAPGLEAVVAAELRALGLPAVETEGGAEVDGDREAVWRANLWSRVATRVLVRVGEARATDFARLRRAVADLEWERFIGGACRLEVSATARRSRLYHTGAIAERVAGGIADRLGAAALSGTEVTRVLARAEHDRFTFSVDSSGELLHRRGWRTEAVEAPLRETLAAGVLALAGWTPAEPLADPTCGSGTFVVEAALLATGRAPGGRRGFAFEHWPGHDAAAFARLVAEETARPAPAPLVGSDRDPAAIAAATANAVRAGVAADTRFECVDVARAPLPGGAPGLLVCNPPYGRRLPALGRVYAAIGALARRSGWRLALLSPDASLAAKAGRFERRIALSNGGVRVWLNLAGRR